MPSTVTPMIHVPDVRATVAWYQSIGFKVIDTYTNDEADGLSFAILSFGNSRVMFNQGGRTSSQHRREVDLYVDTDDVDRLHEGLKGRVEVVEGLHDTFYGMREFIIRDLNRFWITFGQPSAYAVLMAGVLEGKIDLVQSALKCGGLKPEALTAALSTASSGDHQNVEIAQLLIEAGAVLPSAVSERVLQSHVGQYRNDKGMTVNVTLHGNQLFATPSGQTPIALITIDNTTFRPAVFDGITLRFNTEADRTTGIALEQGPETLELKRVEETK